jgi:hypothetical protein
VIDGERGNTVQMGSRGSRSLLLRSLSVKLSIWGHDAEAPHLIDLSLGSARFRTIREAVTNLLRHRGSFVPNPKKISLSAVGVGKFVLDDGTEIEFPRLICIRASISGQPAPTALSSRSSGEIFRRALRCSLFRIGSATALPKP